MRIPYISIKQRGEIFFISRFESKQLKELVNFHFRDPYYDTYSKKTKESFEEYIKKIEEQGIALNFSEQGIQRRLQHDRILDIKSFIEESKANFFPNSILLSVDVSDDDKFEDNYNKMLENDMGYFELNENSIINIIDGQHRLGGIFSCNDEVLESIQIPAIILFNVSVSTAAKLFWDINGKQKPVNKSLVYDLYQDMDENASIELKKYHTICQKLYTDRESPLYRQIKMLGIGDGAISQAFFIDTVKRAMNKTQLKHQDLQLKYSNIFMYLKAFQEVFPKEWPVPMDIHKFNDIELDEYAKNVLTVEKYQLAKTNGFGAIMKLFPDIYKKADGDIHKYRDIISILKNNIEWTNLGGTGKSLQNKLASDMFEILFCCKVEVYINSNLLNDIIICNDIILYDYEDCTIRYNKFLNEEFKSEEEIIEKIIDKLKISENRITIIENNSI